MSGVCERVGLMSGVQGGGGRRWGVGRMSGVQERDGKGGG